jgi:spermidine synthase
MATFEESQPWGTTTYHVVPGTHISFGTEHQKVDLITNPFFGRMLFLDGVLQSASADEAMYHRALIQPVEVMQTVETVLILGGAEGAAAREVFRVYPDVKRVVMVDWDAELVAWMRSHEAGEAERAAFADPRLLFVAVDANVFLSRECSLFDAIYVDLLDPDDDTWEWLADVIVKSITQLSPGGMITMNLGSDRTIIKKVLTYVRRACPLWSIVPYCIFVPSFQEPWYLASISQNPEAALNLKHGAGFHDLGLELE